MLWRPILWQNNPRNESHLKSLFGWRKSLNTSFRGGLNRISGVSFRFRKTIDIFEKYGNNARVRVAIIGTRYFYLFTSAPEQWILFFHVAWVGVREGGGVDVKDIKWEWRKNNSLKNWEWIRVDIKTEVNIPERMQRYMLFPSEWLSCMKFDFSAFVGEKSTKIIRRGLKRKTFLQFFREGLHDHPAAPLARRGMPCP